MPRWEKYLNEEEVIPAFEKFDKTVKNGRRILKRADDLLEEKKQKERERDEERASKRGDEV